MRGLTTRFALGALLLGSVCALADTAQAGPFRRRAAANNACCYQVDPCCAAAPATVGVGYAAGAGVGMYSTPAAAYVQPAAYPAAAAYYDPCCPQQYVGYRGGLFSRGYRYYPQTYSFTYNQPATMPYQASYPPSGIVPAGGFVPGQLPTRPGDAVPGTTPGTTPEAGLTEAKAVRILDGSYEPADLSIPVGATVRWTNEGKKPHTVTSDKGDWGSGELAAGQTFTATFTKPGTFEYHCKLHPDMKAKITVK